MHIVSITLAFAALSVPAAAQGRPCLAAEASCYEGIPAGSGKTLPAYRTFPVTRPNQDIRAAVIVVHGTRRDADRYFRAIVEAARIQGVLDTTLLIAPQFKAHGGACKDPVAEGELFWTCNGWKYGDKALNGEDDSFSAVDAVLRLLAGRERFPALRSIVVTGHSAGGQFVQRYAAGNRIDHDLGLPVRYVVANPSSYMYLDARRPTKNGFGAYEGAADCPDYNKYRYGMEDRAGYLAATPDAEILARFPRRAVTYLAGELDVRQDDPSLDKTCPAMAQGPNRRERALNFANYIRTLYKAGHAFAVVPSCGHDARCIYVSAEGRRAVFPAP